MDSPYIDAHRLEKLRPLGKSLIYCDIPLRLTQSGALEQFSSARHELGFYNNVGISASYTCETESLSTLKDIIFSALSAVILRHPILSAVPLDEDTSTPYFARLPKINLDDAVAFFVRELPIFENERDIELDNILEAQHNVSFKENYGSRPFWRLIVLKNGSSRNEFVASFIFHHALGDGTSGMIFHKHFLSALHTVPAPLPNTIIQPPTTPLLPPLEQLHPLPIPTPSPTPYTPHNLWTAGPISLPNTGTFHSLTLPPTTTSLFLQACRAHSTTITSTLPVLIATSLIQFLPSKFKSLECTIPVTLRRWLPDFINEDVMGVWIDAFSAYYSRENLKSEGFPWEEARRTKGVIGEYLASEGESINVAKFGRIADMREFFLGRVGKERTSSFDVSNLGVMPIVQYEGTQWKVGRVVFSRSAFASGSTFSTGVVSGGDGTMVLGFCWQREVVDRELIEAVIEEVEEGIERIALEQREA